MEAFLGGPGTRIALYERGTPVVALNQPSMEPRRKNLNSKKLPMKTTIRLRSPIAALLAAAYLALSPTSNGDTIFVGDWTGGAVARFTAGGVGSVFASIGLDHPYGLAFDSAGNLYVSSSGDNRIVKLTPGGAGSVFANAGLNTPTGLAFDSAGNLYVANAGNNTIRKFTPGGVGSLFANTGLSVPVGLAFDSAGSLYVANSGNNTIRKFTPGGFGSLFANSGLNDPRGLAFDSAGNLYVANAQANTIEKFTPGGVGSVFTSNVNGPIGLAFDSAGNLYVADSGTDTIDKFTPWGSGTVFAYGPDNPSLVAIIPAPAWTPSPTQALHSPLGTWEVIISGRNHGVAFLTLDSSSNINGYGITLESFDVFIISGTWSLDEKNRVIGTYTETIGGQPFTGSFVGRATTGKRLVAKAVAPNGTFTLNGIPATTTPNISGDWTANVTQRGIIIPESFTLSPINGAPGLFVFTGYASTPNGAFLMGAVTITSKGRAAVVVDSDNADGTSTLSSLIGRFNLTKQTGTLNGVTLSGDRLRAKVTR
jgi:sugar lactone lactonase YvrE